MKSFLVSLLLVVTTASTGHALSPGKAAHSGTTASPAQYKLSLGDTEKGPLNYRADKSKFFYIRGGRYTTISNLMPIAELNVLMVAPTQDYIYYKTYDANLLDSLRVSHGIEINPGYPSPPTPTAPFTDEAEIKGRLMNAYTDVNSGWSHALGSIASNANNRLIVLGMKNDFDDFKLSDGKTLEGSSAQRESFLVSYGRKLKDHTLSYSYLQTAIDDAGIPVSTFDTAWADVNAHIVSYEYAGDSFGVTGELRRINVEQKQDDYNYRPWLPAGAAPGNPFVDPNAHAYFGEINSLVDLRQDIDGWEYRLDVKVPVADGVWTSGIDGTLNDIAIHPTKPWDDPRFAMAPTDPITGALAPDDWRYFDVHNDIEEDAMSFFSEVDLPLFERNDLHLGARLTLHDLETSTDIQPDGVDGRFIFDVLGLRYMLENVYGVNYLPSATRDCSTASPPCSTGTFTPVDRDYSDETVDLVARLTHQVNDNIALSGTLAYFEEQPSGFERAFPAGFDPGSDTTDGQIYFGNTSLDKEKHKRVELAASYDNQSNFFGQARVWYDRVDDYIQGVPMIETTRNPSELEAGYELACNSMIYAPPQAGAAPLTAAYPIPFACIGSNNPLRFDNIDAELYGVDLSWGYKITDELLYSGVAAYHIGKRRDTGYIHNESTADLVVPDGMGGFTIIPGAGQAKVLSGGIEAVEDDDLYRIMPPYAHMALTYVKPWWQASLEGTFFAKQDRASKANNEEETSGYGVANAIFSLTPHPAVRLDMGVNNLFDKEYTNHLTGVSRRFNDTGNPDVLNYGDRIPGLGRNAFVKLTVGFKF